MKRGIKFRAWNIKTKQMIDLHKITPLALRGMDGLFIPFSDKLVLMQFIGKIDKNKKDIYEGDIVHICRNESNDMFQVTIEDIRHIPEEFYGSSFKWSEVVGNIYEKTYAS